MKALISVVALALGLAAVGVVLTVQNDPFAFTRLSGHEAEDNATIVKKVPVVAILEPKVVSEPEDHSVWLDETLIVGRWKSPKRAPVQTVSHEPEVTVIPAPCVDGEYRLLDEHRGVRLMCNVKP